MSEYETVGGSLKLKGIGDKKAKKKKDKERKEDKLREGVERTMQAVDSMASLEEVGSKKEIVDNRTPAERAFARVQAEREALRIHKKAQKSHKEKVAELNSYLEKLSEHHDIPKVSWTK
eukprot:m.173939 g.173939  ORF g.173939 m.173939 type:complete len:119 (-) comp17324_c3_seq2:220-576(-)